MKTLRSTPTSPFGRKVKIAAAYLGCENDIAIEVADPLNENDTLRVQNPLGKMPVLILEDGTTLFDSAVILDFLDQQAGGGCIIPQHGPDRSAALTLQALADGIIDAAILITYEGRHRPKEKHHTPWLNYQTDKITRSLAAVAGSIPPTDTPTVGTISLACALGYLDWRKQVDWRTEFPALVPWLEAFSDRVPAFAKTFSLPT